MAPYEKVVVWRVLMHLGFLFAGMQHFKEMFRTYGLFERYRARVGEQHRGIEASSFEEKVESLKASSPPDMVAEQLELGNNLGDKDIDLLLIRAQRLAATF